MTRLGWLAVAGLSALPASPLPAVAGQLNNGQLIACEANRADVASVAVDGLRFGVEAAYVWASANVRLTMRDGKMRVYKLSGRAEPTDKQPLPNAVQAGFSYPGFTCTVQYPSITSVRNCSGANQRRSCEIGVSLFGMPIVYAVSMTAERNRIVEASTIP